MAVYSVTARIDYDTDNDATDEKIARKATELADKYNGGVEIVGIGAAHYPYVIFESSREQIYDSYLYVSFMAKDFERYVKRFKTAIVIE